MSISSDIRRRQRDWATGRGIEIDSYGYVINDADNLYLPLSPKFASALGADGEIANVAIEQQFPSGLRGTPPTLDVVLSLADERVIAIESKFTEWMSSKNVKLDEFQAKYLKADPGHWAACDLPKCQQLADDIGNGDENFRQLDALQLLKHALGLSKSAETPFSLLYLYYDYADESDIADRHRAEIERFAARVDASLGFRALSYQALFAELAGAAGVDGQYLEFLKAWYF
jgi:hypothetical protein